jgi:hypothetical protein
MPVPYPPRQGSRPKGAGDPGAFHFFCNQKGSSPFAINAS